MQTDLLAGTFISPHTLTILGTYQCTAACKQCCFESSPSVRGRLSGDVILQRITEAQGYFSSLRMVVFSGGEAFLLKDDLFNAVAHCQTLGLHTRIVTNGSWGKREQTAREFAGRLASAGLKEINFSTGKDHQEWVPWNSVANAAHACAEAGISTLITVECDTEERTLTKEVTSDPRISDLLGEDRIRVSSNSWMPFHSDAEHRIQDINRSELQNGCEQIFGNIVVTPHDNLSACCGLTLEHIPEMRLGQLTEGGMARMYRAQADDFLKYWIKVDGPYKIIERVLGEQAAPLLKDVVHICQACVLLHKNPQVVAALSEQYVEYVPEVMTRFLMKQAVDNRMAHSVVPLKEETV